MKDTPSNDDFAVVAIDSLLDRFEGDREFVIMLVGEFRSRFEGALSSLEAHILNSRADDICVEAHALKGSLLGLGGLSAAEALNRLESRARSGVLNDAEDHFQVIRERIAAFLAEMHQLGF